MGTTGQTSSGEASRVLRDACRQIVENREATVDLGVVAFEVRLSRRRRWLEIDAPDGSVGSVGYVGDFKREKLVSVIADYLIIKAANFPQIPSS